MSAGAVYLRCCLCFLILANINCAVIRMNEIPLNENFVMKIAIKEDPKTKAPTATIKIVMDEKVQEKAKEVVPSLLSKLVADNNEFVPDLGNRLGIVSGSCAVGQVRRGPKCVKIS